MAEKEYIERESLVYDVEKSLRDNPHTDPKSRLAHTNEHLHFIATISRQPAADVVEVQQIEKVKQEILARMIEFISEYRGISQSDVDYFGGKAESMEVASRLVNAALTDLCSNCSAKMDGKGDENQ